MKAEELISEYVLAQSNLRANLTSMDNIKSVTSKVVGSSYLDATERSCQEKLNKAAERFTECNEKLTDAITSLGDSRYIDVLCISVLGEYSMVRTAEIMGYSVRNAQKLKAEALRELDKVLEK